MKAISMKLLLPVLIVTNAAPNSSGQFGLFGPFQGSTISPSKKAADGSGLQVANKLSSSKPKPIFNLKDYIQAKFRNLSISTSTSKKGLIWGMGADSPNPTNPKVSQQENPAARLNRLETEFRQKIEEIMAQTSRNNKAQDEKIEVIKAQTSKSTKIQDENIELMKVQISKSTKALEDKVEEIRAQLSRSTKTQDEKIEEIKTQTSRNSKDQDEKIAIIKVRERNLAQLLNQTMEDMVVLKTENRDQSKKIEELERKLSIQSTQPAPSTLNKPDNSKEVTGMPTNCNELNQIGHSLNGFYLVRGQGSDKRKTKIETIFCNFKKNEASPSVQETRVGYVDVKHSEGVLFILTGRNMLNPDNSYKGVPILFDKEEINIGRGMNVSTSVFTAPRTGLYEFRYSEVFPATNKKGILQPPIISLRVNARTKSSAPFHPFQSSDPSSSSFGDDGLLVNLESLQMLKIGDRVELSIYPRGYKEASTNSFWSRYASYSGRLVEEDLIF